MVERGRSAPRGGAARAVERLVLIVRVGFTGHRDLGRSDPDGLRREVERGLGAMREAAREIAREQPDVYEGEPRVQLFTGLAAGADQIAARACLDLGLELVAVSPFAWEEFASDFEGDAGGLEAARAIWNAPGVERVELDAAVERPGPTLDERFRQGEPHYEALGRFVVGQADLVLAFLDPTREPSGAGGARQVLAQAELRDIPRLVVRPDGAGFATELQVGRGEATLAAVLRRAAAPPPGVERTTGAGAREAKPGNRPTYLANDYWREAPPARRSAFSRAASGVFERVVRRLGGSPRGTAAGREPDRAPDFVPPALVAELERADSLANHYNGLHRAAFLAIYLLGFLAVLSAVLGHLGIEHRVVESRVVEHRVAENRDVATPGGSDAPAHPPVGEFEPGATEPEAAVPTDAPRETPRTDVPPSSPTGSAAALECEPVHAVSPWSTVEIVSLTGVLGLFLLARRARYREKGTDYRLLAEMLRVAVALWPVRTRIRFREPRVQGSDGAVIQTWMAWYARAFVRQLAPVGARFDPAYLRRCTAALREDLVEDQIRFHTTRVHRYAKLEKMINVLVVVLFAAALYGCVAHVAHAPLSVASLVMTAALPALAAALHGIATHAEFSRLERRYHAMGEYLEDVLTDLPPGRSLPRSELEAIVQEVSGRMIDEVAEWRWLHAVHDPKL